MAEDVAPIFLTGGRIAEAINRELKNAQDVRICVAYWGHEALTRVPLRAQTGRKIRIICNATSGGCNPQALEQLLDRSEKSPGLFKVKTHKDVHAKIWITTGSTIVASANASTNGLWDRDDTTAEYLIEAGSLIHDRRFHAASAKWFDRLWDADGCCYLSKEHIDTAWAIWNSRPKLRRVFTRELSLFEAFKDEPEALQALGIILVQYQPSNPSAEANRVTERLAKDIIFRNNSPNELHREYLGIDSYEETTLAGYHHKCWIIDLAGETTLFYYVPDKAFAQSIAKGKRLLVPLFIRDRLQLTKNVGLKLTKTDLVQLRKLCRRRRLKDEWVP